MLTKNAKTLLKLYRQDNYMLLPPLSSAGYTHSRPGFYEVKDINGNTYFTTVAPGSSGITFISDALSGGSSGIAIGSDGHEESESDYVLGSQITGLTGTPVRSVYDDTENSKEVVRIDITIPNNTAEEVTVREIGFFVAYNTASNRGENVSSSGTSKRCIMIDRTVLEQPITIPAGEARVIRYEFAY